MPSPTREVAFRLESQSQNPLGFVASLPVEKTGFCGLSALEELTLPFCVDFGIVIA